VFGLSLGEIMVLAIVGIVVVGPKNLPMMMRTAGQWVSKLRRMSTDLRAQSGIDDLIRAEGLEKEIHELRSLSRMNVVETLIAPMAAAGGVAAMAGGMASGGGAAMPVFQAVAPLREREYPLIGCDAYRVLADDAYVEPPAEGDAEAGANGEAANGDGANGDANGAAKAVAKADDDGAVSEGALS
jgi:sec-independent protein translocase protein TatB